MKKKILIILSLVLLLASLFCLVAVITTAEDAEPELSISAKALLIQNSVDIRYFVVAKNVANIYDVKLLVWNEPQENYVKGTEYAVVGYSGKGAPYQGVMEYYYDFEGVNAKMMADVFYAVPYLNLDGKEYYGEPHKYSVLEYAYNMMGKLDKEASTNTNLVNMLDVMLDYGAMAQKYFNYKTDRLANDSFYQVKVDGGLISDGFAKGLYLKGDEVVITANDATEGKEFSHWQNSAGEVVATTQTATITVGEKNDVYSPVYSVAYSVGLEYAENGDYYTVVRIGDCTDTSIIIPATYSGKAVTAIADEAFAGNTSIKDVFIPATVKTVGASAFDGCTALETVTFGDNPVLESIGAGAFAGCTALTEFTVPANVTGIGGGVFAGCASLTAINVENGSESYKSIDGNVYSYDGKAFVQYAVGKSDTAYEILDGATSIAPEAFSGASSLKTVIIPEGVTVIGNGAFIGCASISEVYFGGTDEGWSAISIEANNECIDNATLYCTKLVGDDEWNEDGSDTPIIGAI